MKNFATLFRRELAAYFVSPSAYVTMVVSLLVIGICFWGEAIQSRGDEITLAAAISWPVSLGVFVLIVIAGILTMRLFAEEKKTGTIEPLMTAPVTEVEVVLSKYFAALAVFLVIMAPTAAYVFILRSHSIGMGYIDVRPLAAAYFILALIAAFYVSIGLLMSALTKSQIVAALTTFAALSVIFSLGALPEMLQGSGGEILRHLSAFEQILQFSDGLVDSRPIVFYLSGTALVLFATVKVIESRRWM
jgi:ABC-2 type transport system permease protein